MKTLGKYELLEELASGGMGKICRGRDRVLHREVAIKTIFTGQTDPEIKQRFYREARACALLSHPNIVTVFDLGEQQGVSYIAMEFLEGEDLRRFIDRRGTMSLEAKIGFMSEVCDGLAHAHDNGIVHRDIKPGNIFITRSGRPKILDFGVARITTSHLTQPGTALGTPRYMAPEQYLGKECDALSDLFSAAMVFFEFLTYAHPFDGSNIPYRSLKEEPPGPGVTAEWASDDVPSRIVKEEPLSLRGLNPAMPERLEKIFSKALSKDPQARYQTANELARELRKVSVDLVRECSRVWNEVLDHRKRILELESTLGDYLRTAWVQTVLKKGNVDLITAEKIKPDTSATVVSNLHYFELVSQLDEIEHIENLLIQIAEDVSKARQDAEEANILLQKGDIEGATRIMRPLSERFPDHAQITSLMREIRLRSSAAALEKSLSENNLVRSLELLNDIQSIGGTNPESIALVGSLQIRVGDALAAQDLLCDSVRATLRQLQNAATGGEALRIEMLASSLGELTQELERRYGSDRMPGDIKELLSSCRMALIDADLQVAHIKVREALTQGNLQAVRKHLQVIKEICAGNPKYEHCLVEVQREVVESVLVSQDAHSVPGADRMHEAPTQTTPVSTAAMQQPPGKAATIVEPAPKLETQQPPEEAAAIVEQVPAPTLERIAPPTIQSDRSLEAGPGKGDGWAEQQRAVTQITPPRSRICPQCGARNSIANAKCFQCSAPLVDTGASKFPLKVLRFIKGDFWGFCIRTVKSFAGAVQAASAKLVLLVQRLSPKQKRVVFPVAAAVIVIPLLYLLLHSTETHTIGPVIVGKAQILGTSVPLRSEPRDNAPLLATMSLGEPVEIMNQVPAKASDAWVAVRRQSGRSASGYVKLNQLTGANTGVSEFDLWCARSIIPDPNKSDPAELRMRLNDAEGALARVLEGSESIQLQLQLANGYALLASRTLPDYATAEKYAERAQHHLDRLKDQRLVSAECERIRAILDRIAKAVPANPASRRGNTASFGRDN